MFKRKQDQEPPKRNNGWLVSYGDLITTLLCFFIILSSLAEDQTGVRLQAGLDSFRDRPLFPWYAQILPNTTRHLKLPSAGPDSIPEYLTSPDRDPDRPNDRRRFQDLEKHAFQRFVEEMNRHFAVAKMRKPIRKTAVDMFGVIGRRPPFLSDEQNDQVWQMLPLLRQPHHRIYVVVWAATPSDSAWKSATVKAHEIADYFAKTAGLTEKARGRLIPLGRTWSFPNAPRPALSFFVEKTD